MFMKVKTALSEEEGEIGIWHFCNSPQKCLTPVIYIEEVKRDSSYKRGELHKSEQHQKESSMGIS